jgi:C4-dicarboxylate transporter DctM subunit
VIILALQLGTVHPPVGVYLFLANKMAGGRLEDSVVEVLPFIGVMVLVLLLATLAPQVVLFIPSFFYDAAR